MKIEKKKANEITENITSSSGFPIPLTLEGLRQDILTLYFQQMRTVGWMAGAKAFWSLIERKSGVDESACFDPDIDPKDIGLEYNDISNTEFAKSIEQMYQYAYHGIQDESAEPLDNESTHMWIAAILSDLANSRVADEWESYGAEMYAPAKRCLEVAELANARRVLEGSPDNFFHFSGKGKDDDAVGLEALTIRQMALIAGMEEMSIRAAANPKRANPLPTYSEEGHTRIATDAAKAWLISKGRYVPIQRTFSSGDIDLKKRRFTSLNDLVEMVDARIHMIRRRDNTDRGIAELLFGAGIMIEVETGFSNLNVEAMNDPEKLRILAEALEFDPRLLSLRAREALANDELGKVERELREISHD